MTGQTDDTASISYNYVASHFNFYVICTFSTGDNGKVLANHQAGTQPVGEDSSPPSPTAQLEKAQFALNIKHALFNAML